MNEKWIKCSDRLPAWDGRYITYSGRDVLVREMTTNGLGHRHWMAGQRFPYKQDDVTHWMPLPEPPKADDHP